MVESCPLGIHEVVLANNSTTRSTKRAPIARAVLKMLYKYFRIGSEVRKKEMLKAKIYLIHSIFLAKEKRESV